MSKGPLQTSQLEEPTVTQTSRILASSVLESEELSKGPLYDVDDIDHDKTDTFKSWSKPRIRNTKYEIRNTKYEKQKKETRSKKYEIRNTKYRISANVVLYCTYMHTYVHRTCIYVCV